MPKKPPGSKESYLKSQARGATIKGIKIDVLASLDIPDIPFNSQQEIVAGLDKARNILVARRSQLSALDDLIKARFVEMFGTIHDNKFAYRIMTIQDVCEPMKDLSVLQEAPFTDQGSIVEVFTDLSVWMGIRKIIDQVNANAVAA